MRPIYFNGKFYSGGLNGVHRVADRLIREVDAIIGTLPQAERPEVSVLLPSNHKWEPTVQHIAVSREPKWKGQLWEQAILPFRARDGVLVNLCNLAPVAHWSKFLMIHDAQFLFPDSSYPARQRWGYRVLAPLMARTSREVWTVSNYSQQMLDLFGVSRRARTSVVYNGVDHMEEVGCSRPANMSDDPFVVMFSSAKEYKNCQVVFRAFEDPALARVKLVLIGSERAALSAVGMTPPSNAVFLGRLGDEEVRFLLESAICLTCPSRTEGFGLPPLEAMICGCPAVVAPAGAIPEVCRDAASYAGIDDPGEWVRAILRLDNDGEWRRAKVAAGRCQAAKFTWRTAGQQVFERMKTAATEPRSRSR
jgi:glycosyltransferase involved in cell wall biosynthesis